jgi:hypothetical protein
VDIKNPSQAAKEAGRISNELFRQASIGRSADASGALSFNNSRVTAKVSSDHRRAGTGM